MRKGLGVALVTAAWLLFSTSARAGDPAPGAPPKNGARGSDAQGPQPSDEARADAEKRLDEGLDRYAKGDFEGARLAFAQAYAVLTSIDLLYNLTRAELKSSHPLEALVHIHQLLRNPNATTEDRAKAERLREEANRTTGHVAVEAPEGGEIVIDHVPSGETPVTEAYDVVPGKHVVEVRSNGSSRTIEVDAPAGQLVTARFETEAGRAPTVSAPVPVPTNASPSPPPPPPQARKEAPAPPQVEHEAVHHESKARIIVPIVIGAIGVAALGVGIGMGFASQSEESSATSFRTVHPGAFCANQASATCQEYAGILNSQQQDTNASRVTLISGGVLAAAAVVTVLAWPRAGKERGAWVAPTLGGAVVGGVF
jgi:hypothetical protein